MKRRARVLLLAILCITAAACGLDSVGFLEYVDDANVRITTNTSVTVYNLPRSIDWLTLDYTENRIPSITSSDLNTYHTYFQIFYRIYLSNVLISSTISEIDLPTINPTLASDYAALKPYTVKTNYYAASVGSAFASRNYWNIDDASGPNILRSSGLITPYPSDRFFFNAPDLKNVAYLNPNNNADVVTNSEGTAYAYVSQYIVNTELNSTTLALNYSAPTFLGVYLLPYPSYYDTVAFSSLTVSPPPGPTAELTLTLGKEIPALTVDDITINDSSPPTGIQKGTLTNVGAVYTLTVTSITAPGTITVSLQKDGFNFQPATRTVTVSN